MPLAQVSSIYIISTLFYCLTIEQFLMQPDPGAPLGASKIAPPLTLGASQIAPPLTLGAS